MKAQIKNEKEFIEYAGWKCRAGSKRDGLPTMKQVQTIACLAAGMSQKEIARLRGVSPNTVKSTVMGINFWLNTTKSAAAVAEAMRRGWISPLCIMLVMFSLTAGMQQQAMRVRPARQQVSSVRIAQREAQA